MAGMNDLLDAIDALPGLPDTAARLIAALHDDTTAPQEIVQIMRYDEALTSLVLRLGNSVEYGRPGRIFNLEESISRLGRMRVLQACLQMQVSGLLDAAGESFGLRRGAIRRSAVGGAVIADELARARDDVAADEAFLGGLLRDIGKLVLDYRYGEQYIRSLAPHLRAGQNVMWAERAAFGFDHAQVGEALGRAWHLPDRLASAIGCHHDPPAGASEHDPLFDVIHAADVICLWAGLGVGDDGLAYPLSPHVRDGLRIDRSLAEALMMSAWTHVRQLDNIGNGSETAQEQIL